MSSASNMGYGGTSPYYGINTNLVNTTNSNDPAWLQSRQIPSSAYSMTGASSNIDAAAGRLSGGGTKYYKLLKRKIKNITKRYKMRGKSKRTRITRMKRKIRASSKRMKTRTRSRRKTRTRSQRMTGGTYHQFGSNVAQSANYSVGGILNANSLGQANPPPIQINPPSCQDNDNHYNLGR